MRSILAAACVAFTCVAASGCKGCAPEQGRAHPPALDADKAAILATLGGVDAAGGSAGGAQAPSFAVASEFVFATRGAGVAWVEEGGGLSRVVHNGRAGRTYAAVGTVVLSPDGARASYPAQNVSDGQWRMVVDESEGPGFAQVETAVFSANGAHVAYQARAGDRWHLVVDGAVGDGAPGPYPAFEFAAGPRVVWVEDVDERGLGRLVVSDLARTHRTAVDGRVGAFVLNAAGSRVAAVTASGTGESVVTFGVDAPDRAARGPLADAVHGVAFGQDGASLAYVAERAGTRTIVLDGREAPLPPGDLVGASHEGVPVIRPDNAAVGVLLASGGSVVFREIFGPAAPAEPAHDEAEGLVYSSDGRAHAYAARSGERWFVVANGKEGPPFERVVSPAFSSDNRYLVYRARRAGKRFVVVADSTGATIRELPAYEQVFPVRFTADGKSIAFGVKDGRQLAWKVERL